MKLSHHRNVVLYWLVAGISEAGSRNNVCHLGKVNGGVLVREAFNHLRRTGLILG